MNLYPLICLVGTALILSGLVSWFQGVSVHITYMLLVTAGVVFLVADLATGRHDQSIADGAALAYVASAWWWAARRNKSQAGLTEVQKNWRAFHKQEGDR